MKNLYECVSPKHPDVVADRIANMLVMKAYEKSEKPIIAVEVMIGHNSCVIKVESNVDFTVDEIREDVERICEIKGIDINLQVVPQDVHLSKNQETLHVGDNGVFFGRPVSETQQKLKNISKYIYDLYETDGKYIIRDDDVIICQSKVKEEEKEKIKKEIEEKFKCNVIEFNKIGYWEGGVNTDVGITGRKQYSQLGDSMTGGAITGKDLSKADVSVNIYCHLKAQELKKEVVAYCSIGDTEVSMSFGDNRYIKVPFRLIVDTAKEYIDGIGGFGALAEWGLIRPTI